MTPWSPFRADELVHGLRTFAAGALALFVAFSLDLDRPYWALLTVYLVSQPMAGMTRSKGFYRAIGTLIGATATVAMVPNLAEAPELLCLALASWIALCLYFSLLQDPPRNYAFILSGYTTALIGFPSVDAPGQMFLTALTRAEEIGLGIACAVLMNELVLPQPAGPRLLAGLDAWLNALGRGAASLLRGGEGPDRRHLAAELQALSVLSAHAGYDTPALQSGGDALAALLQDMRRVLLRLTGLAARLTDTGIQVSEVGAAAADWFGQGTAASAGEAERLHGLIAARRATTEPHAGVVGALFALDDAVRDWENCLEMREQLLSGLRRSPAAPRGPLGRHRDRAIALRSGIAVWITVLVCCAGWIGTGWPAGSTAALLSAVICCFFATLDDPAPSIMGFLTWATVGSVLAGVWLFGVLPQIAGFELLMASLACALVPLSAAAARPTRAPWATPFILGFISLLAIQGAYAANFTTYADGVLAQTIGVWIAAVTTRMLRSMGAEEAVGRLLAGGRAELVRIARGAAVAPEAFAGRMFDRLAAISVRLPATSAAAADAEAALLADLRAGWNFLALRTARAHLPAAPARAVDLVMETVRKDLSAGGPPRALGRRIAQASERLAAAPRAEAVQQAEHALDGLRRALLPGESA
jgi:uncharacterized membrane protein YccC